MNKRILLVDDDEAIRDSIGKVLQHAGYSVSCAGDGEEAIAQVDRHDCDLMLLDIELPKINGWEVLDAACTLQPLLPVIILTSFRDQCEPGAARLADLVLQKPPDVAQLLASIEQLLAAPPEARLARAAYELTPAHGAGYLKLFPAARKSTTTTTR